MPHAMPRVSTFFRNHASTFELPTDFKKGKRRSSSTKRPAFSDRSVSSSGSSIASEDRSVKMHDNHKRLSLVGLHSPKSSSSKIPQLSTLDITYESPPAVLLGPAASSTGALCSFMLVLKVHEETMVVDSFNVRLALEVTRKKPFHAHCQECTKQCTDLKNVNLFQGPVTLRKGEHTFPFSSAVDGHLPASMKGALTTIEYVVRATITPKTGEPIKSTYTLNVQRAIKPEEIPRNSIRVFPPTNLTAKCTLPNVIHPIGEVNIEMRMDGIVKRNTDTKMQNQWKLKRLTWRLDETQKTISPACPKHAAKLGNVEEGKKGIAHQDVRTIGTDEMKSGWKSDYNSPDGTIELLFPIGIRPDSKPICDMKAEDGTEVSHVLIVEMIVAEEFAPIKKPSQVTPTGAARVLRMHFNMVVTERGGLGISWDEEQPPLYEDVPASPPTYINPEPYEGDPIPDYEDLTPLDDAESPMPGPLDRNGTNGNDTPTAGPSRLHNFGIDDLTI